MRVTTSQTRSHILGTPRSKGNTLNGFVAFIQEFYPTAWNGTLARLTPEQRVQVTGLLLASGWYPFGLVRDLTSAFFAETQLDVALVAPHWGAYVMERDLKGGIYRIFLNVASPRMILKAFGRLWGFYHDTGAVDVVDESAGAASCLLHGLHLASRAVCYGTVGASARLLELAGGQDVKTQILSGVGENDRYCAWEITWR